MRNLILAVAAVVALSLVGSTAMADHYGHYHHRGPVYRPVTPYRSYYRPPVYHHPHAYRAPYYGPAYVPSYGYGYGYPVYPGVGIGVAGRNFSFYYGF